MDAVVLDLFGTIVAAPTPSDRMHGSSRLARVIGCHPSAVERYFRATWHVRHDGTLATVLAIAEHLVQAVSGRRLVVEPVADELRALGRARLIPQATVVQTLSLLRESGFRLGVLSDASAEIAAAWATSPLASVVDAVLFSCTIGYIKPDQRLYAHISDELGVRAQQALYVGDGGGDELRGALDSGMTAVAVRRRGPSDALAFGDAPWPGPVIDAVERLPSYVARVR